MTKVAIVIGGSGNIGAPLVGRFCDIGYRVVAVARHKRQLLPLGMGASNRRVVIRTADARRERETIRLFDEVKATFKRIDVLVYTPGIEPDLATPVARCTAAQWRDTFDVYTYGFFLALREGLRVVNSGGHIVVVSSAVTRFRAEALPEGIFAGPYASAKAAVDELCKWGRREAHDRGIYLSRLSPGAIATPFHLTAPPERRPPGLIPMEQVVETITSSVCEGREFDLQLVSCPRRAR
jgi:NAD(P)-dependent dehydrogenase (short-subunit alcohol dehydrogenase family)